METWKGLRMSLSDVDVLDVLDDEVVDEVVEDDFVTSFESIVLVLLLLVVVDAEEVEGGAI